MLKLSVKMVYMLKIYLVFKQLCLSFQWRWSTCYKYPSFSLSVSEFLSNPPYPYPHTIQIAEGLLCISSVEISKYYLTTFMYIYRLLSTPYNVSPYRRNKTYYNPSVIQVLFKWNVLVCAEDNSGFILKPRHDDGLWYWVANWYKCCNWVIFNKKGILII
jgi:hypothetical protein